MRIPFDYLSDSLNRLEIQEYPPADRRTPMSRPKFLLQSSTPESGRLYIAAPDTAADAARHLPASSGILSERDPAVLLNRLQELYDQCEAWEEALTAAAATGEMRELLDEIESILGNPVVVYKSNFAIVACSGEIFSNPMLGSLRGSHLPFDYVTILKRDPTFRQHTPGEPFFCASPITGAQAMATELLQEEEISYRLSVIPLLRPLPDSSRFLLSLCAGYVTQLLQNTVIAGRFADPTGRKERLVELFRTGVENESADVIVLEQGFSALGWLPVHRYCCLSIRIGSTDYLNHTVELLCNQLETLLPSACVFSRTDTIAVLLNLSQSGLEVRTILEKCVYFFRDNDLRVGVSNTFSGFQELRSYNKQSCIALDFSSRPQAFLWIQYFSDVVLDYILEQSNRELPLNLICSQQILDIRQYDRTHQTDFYTTLDCYIRNKFNAVQTAKELQIHRSTFLYRMERLQSLFDLDLDQKDALLYVLLSMKMLESSKTMMHRE